MEVKLATMYPSSAPKEGASDLGRIAIENGGVGFLSVIVSIVGNLHSFCVTFSPNSKDIAFILGDRTIHVRDLETGHALGKPFHWDERGSPTSMAFSAA